MYLLDTNVISEIRKKSKANKGVKSFFKQMSLDKSQLFISVITIGELRRGVELVRYRGDIQQAKILETWLIGITQEYRDFILPFSSTEAQIWGRLRVPNYENAIDKQIAATALAYDLCIVTRNTSDFIGTGVRTINPFR